MSSRDTTRKKKSRPKHALDPISMEEILAGPGMSGFVSILDPREEVPHLQALVDDIKGSARRKAPATAKQNVISLPRPAASETSSPVEVAEPPPKAPAPMAERAPGPKR